MVKDTWETRELALSIRLPIILDNMSKTILERFRLDGRVALVTGAGQGIGKAFAFALGEAGAKVAIVDVRAEVAEQVSNELKERHVETISVTANVADPQSVEAMVTKVINHFSALHIAFNNAGVNMNSAARTPRLKNGTKRLLST